jgi:hypothetical protein
LLATDNCMHEAGACRCERDCQPGWGKYLRPPFLEKIEENQSVRFHNAVAVSKHYQLGIIYKLRGPEILQWFRCYYALVR